MPFKTAKTQIQTDFFLVCNAILITRLQVAGNRALRPNQKNGTTEFPAQSPPGNSVKDSGWEFSDLPRRLGCAQLP